jgi:hypothetical protein
MPIIAVLFLLIAGMPVASSAQGIALFAGASGSPPAIGAFVASPAKVRPGDPSVLSWTVTGATTLTINAGAVTGKSVTVKPAATTSYTLTATNSFGTTKAAVTVMVGSPPTITSFIASPAKVAQGQSSTLSWVVTGSPGMILNPGVGPVTGTSVVVKPSATTTYTLSATNSFGSATASVTVTIGTPPGITSFARAPAMVTAGQPSTLSWAVTGSTGVNISPGVGAVTGTSVVVKPSATTTYTLTATNTYGSTNATATVVVGSPPTITGFTASPATVTPGQPSTLSWAVTGSPGMMMNPGVGPVTGTSVVVKPAATTTYTLSATNSFGSTSAKVTVVVGSPAKPPVVTSFFANPANAGPGMSATLHWATSGATSVSIDNGVGTVPGITANVSPSSTTTYTLTATNAAGITKAAATVNYYPLAKVNSQLFYSEHAIYIIPPPDQVTWTGSNSWGSVYSTANVNSYVNSLKSLFPDDYVFVVVAANQLTPNTSPNVQPLRRTADGIGLGSTGVGVPSICRYNIGGALSSTAHSACWTTRSGITGGSSSNLCCRTQTVTGSQTQPPWARWRTSTAMTGT